MELLDTDVLIDVQRGHPPALAWFNSLTDLPAVPGFVVMELIQDARNTQEVRKATKLVVGVPEWIMAILYADPIAAGLARSGEIRFEPECGLDELRTEWHNLTKRVIPL